MLPASDAGYVPGGYDIDAVADGQEFTGYCEITPTGAEDPEIDCELFVGDGPFSATLGGTETMTLRFDTSGRRPNQVRLTVRYEDAVVLDDVKVELVYADIADPDACGACLTAIENVWLGL